MEFEFPLSVLDPHTDLVDARELNLLLQKDFQNVQILVRRVDQASAALEAYSKEQLTLADLRQATRPAIRGLLDQRNLEEHAQIFAEMHVVDQLKDQLDLTGLHELGVITDYEQARIDSGKLMLRSQQDRINYENEVGEYSLEEDFGHLG
ncbi:hypothetical protein LFYK43_17000 [Ligilactobacillus salitolerans]|uniref:Uncharacterized protein n=1 Tax=Ligilactobacillus salitolerans TaxID=1808352 RepID=A0A401IUM2_9LACO|nr:hypothetical protein [Ligilactobacillus salitolerans]GBG95241.1 hypothetical protein LFYK43_17000 [Ligilactobacillus salitolerans]